MELEPVNLVEVIGVTLGMVAVLMPIAGLTLRFALKPIVDAMPRAEQTRDAELARLQRRVLELEQHVAKLPVDGVASLDDGRPGLRRVRS